MKSRFFWFNMNENCRSFCKACDTCQICKTSSSTPVAKLSIIKSTYPWQLIGIDVGCPLTCTPRGNKYIIVAIDYFSKYVEAICVKSYTAEITSKFVNDQIILRHGSPDAIITDQGSNFESKLFKSLCDQSGIKKIRTTAYHPQGNGLVERQNKTLKSLLSCFINDHHNNWDTWLRLLHYYNTSFVCLQY